MTACEMDYAVSCIHGLILKIEGVLVDTAPLRYETWLKQAVDTMGIIPSEEEFKKFWCTTGIKNRDEAVYEELKKRASSCDRFPEKETVLIGTNTYYEAHLNAAKIPEKADVVLRSFLYKDFNAKDKDVDIVIISDETPERTMKQLALLKDKAGLVFDVDQDVVFGHSGDRAALYSAAFDRINKKRAVKELPNLLRENVLVLDSEEYHAVAGDLGMKARTLDLKHPEHLRPREGDSMEAKLIDWAGVYPSVPPKRSSAWPYSAPHP